MNVIIRQITLTLVVSLTLVCSEPPLSTQYGVPANLPVDSINDEPHNGFTNSYGAPLGSYGRQDVHQDYIDSQPKSYEFGYAVKDSATGNDFGRQETSDGETVRGEYRVQLPDGRTQIVIYTADWKTGFHADVRYEGEATYPEQNNNGYSNNNQNNHNMDYINYNNYNNDNINNNNNHHQHNGYNAANNNLNSYDAVGYNYNQNNHNEYDGDNQHHHHHHHHHHHQNNHRNYNDLNNNNYQYSSQSNQYNGFNGNNLDSQSPRTTYGAPQYH